MIKIITDSTASLPREFAQQHGIEVVPLKILFSDIEFEEGYPGEYDGFYNKLEETHEFPKTSLPAPERFAEVFARLTKEGHEVICITLSSSLSGTFQSACVGAQNFADKVSVIDSEGCCQTILFLIEEMLEMIDEDKSRDEIVKYIKSIRANSYMQFVPDTMEYLKRGGRITMLKATVASILRIKPILVFKGGELTTNRKALGMNMAINEMVAGIPANVKKVFALCIGKSPFFESLQKKIREKCVGIVVRVGEISPVMGAHVGPGTLGIACII